MLRFSSDLPKVPYIKSQSLLLLHAPPEKRKECLNPSAFRTLRGENVQHRKDEKPRFIDDDCCWEPVTDRTAFLLDDKRKKLCITIDAGIGKTACMIQIQFLRSNFLPGHICLGLGFEKLPTNFQHYLDTEKAEDAALVGEVEHLKDDQCPLTHKESRSELQRTIRGGRVTLLVDAMDQVHDFDKAQQRAEELRKFLERYPQVSSVVAGRPNSIYDHWNDLFDSPAPWDFAQVAGFTNAEAQAYLGKDRCDKLEQIQSDLLSTPRMLETLRGVPDEKLPSIRTASDIYWQATLRMLEKGMQISTADIKQKEALLLYSLLAFESVRGVKWTPKTGPVNR